MVRTNSTFLIPFFIWSSMLITGNSFHDRHGTSIIYGAQSWEKISISIMRTLIFLFTPLAKPVRNLSTKPVTKLNVFEILPNLVFLFGPNIMLVGWQCICIDSINDAPFCCLFMFLDLVNSVDIYRPWSQFGSTGGWGTCCCSCCLWGTPYVSRFTSSRSWGFLWPRPREVYAW